MIAACEASLRRLGVDHIDLYYIHRPSTQTAIDETLRALDDLVRAGKIGAVGTSAFAGWQIVEALWCASDLGLNRPVVEQAAYHLLDRRAERDLVVGQAGSTRKRFRPGRALPAYSCALSGRQDVDDPGDDYDQNGQGDHRLDGH